MKYYFAPIQGHTDAAYRHYHAEEYGKDAVIYTTPFIRLEKGELRKKDIKEIITPLNDNINVLSQIIFKDGQELDTLVTLLKDEGISEIDLNMGCPFPLQVSRGRGAASVANPECIDAVKRIVTEYPEIKFSIKMRLGVKEEEWLPLIEKINSINVDHITVHPRTSIDQYSGQLRMDAFEEIYNLSKNPIVYNGDILTPEDAHEIMIRYPNLHGIMIGRGALCRPSIFSEIIEGSVMDEETRVRRMKEFHRMLLTYYRQTLIGGEHQVLDKIRPFWEYAEEEIGRKAWKALKKASNMSKYQTALAMI